MRIAGGLFALWIIFMSAPAGAIEIQVTNAWIRSALSGQMATDAYMDLHSDTAVTLVGASTPWARQVEIRNTDDSVNVPPGAAVNGVSLPANKHVKLVVGGYHLSLVSIVRDIGNGEWVPITLDFQDAANTDYRVDIQAQARGNMFPPGPPPPPLQR